MNNVVELEGTSEVSVKNISCNCSIENSQVKFFTVDTNEIGQTILTFSSRPQSIVRNGMVQELNENLDEDMHIISKYTSQRNLGGQVILEGQPNCNVIVARGRNAGIVNAEKNNDINLPREIIWLDGLEHTPGIIVLPYDDYSRVYVLEGDYSNPQIRFIDDKETSGGIRPYYEKPGDGKTYIYVDGFSGASGTQEAPYIIQTLQELQDIAVIPSAHYVLGNDIDASDTVNWNGGAGFAPIVDFTGSFDGNGHSISNLHIDRNDYTFIGLFSNMNGASCSNVTFINPFIRNTNVQYSSTRTSVVCGLGIDVSFFNCTIDGGTVYSDGRTSAPLLGICSRGDGTFSDIYINNVKVTSGAKDSVSSGSGIVGIIRNGVYNFTNCHATNMDITSGQRVGGIIAEIAAPSVTLVMDNCSFSGELSGESNVGGIVGLCGGGSSHSYTFSKCSSNVVLNDVGDNFSSSFAGFAAALRDATIAKLSDCYAIGEIRTSASTAHISGFVSSFSSVNLIEIERCFSIVDIGIGATDRFHNATGFINSLSQNGDVIISQCFCVGNVSLECREFYGFNRSISGNESVTINDCFVDYQVLNPNDSDYEIGLFGFSQSISNNNVTLPKFERVFTTLDSQYKRSNSCGFAWDNPDRYSVSDSYCVFTPHYNFPVIPGVEVKTLEELKQQSTFVNWDFVNTWKIDEGIGYPELIETPLPLMSKLVSIVESNGSVIKEYQELSNSEIVASLDVNENLSFYSYATLQIDSLSTSDLKVRPNITRNQIAFTIDEMSFGLENISTQVVINSDE